MVFPSLLALVALLFLYRWMVHTGPLDLSGFFVSSLFFLVLFWMHYSKAPRIARRVTASIIGALSVLLLSSGYFLHRFNQESIREADLAHNLSRLDVYRQIADGFFETRLSWFSVLTSRLMAADSLQERSIGRDFLDNHPGELVSLYVLDAAGTTLYSVPPGLELAEKPVLDTISRPVFLEPSFTVAMSAGVESRLTGLRCMVPFVGAHGARRYLAVNLVMEELTGRLSDRSLPGSVFLVSGNEVLFASNGDYTGRPFRSQRDEPYSVNKETGVFVTTGRLSSIPWSVITTQTLEEAFPGMHLVERELAWILFLCGLAGILAGLGLAWYLSRSVLTPVSQLSADAQMVARGDLNHPIRPTQAVPDEVAQLSESVARMVEALREKMDEWGRLNERLQSVQEELDRQLRAAHRIQTGLLPKGELRTGPLRLQGRLWLAQQVGGDHYDYFDLDPDRVAILLIDASGQGVSASFHAALVRGLAEFLLRSGGKEAGTLAGFFTHIEKALITPSAPRGTTVAVQVAVVEKATGSVHLFNAGFEPPVLCRDGRTVAVPLSGRAVGMPELFGPYGELVLQLSPGDRLVFHSDGLDERAAEQWARSLSTGTTTLDASTPEDAEDDALAVVLSFQPVHREETTIPSTRDSELPVIQRAGAVMRSRGFTDTCINDFQLALREGLVNAIKHGNRYDRKRRVTVVLNDDEGFVEAVIRDQGEGFNPAALSDPDLRSKLEGKQRKGGWGLKVIDRLVSSWFVHPTAAGTTLILRMTSDGPVSGT